MQPIAVWKPTFAKLPEGSRRVCLMGWGLTFLFCALVIIRGFDFDALFEDWGFEQPEPPSAISEAIKRAKKKADEDLEESLNRLVGEDLEEVEFLNTQCVVLGYTLTDSGQLNSVILASAPRGQLAYVGLLSQADIPEESRREVLRELRRTRKLKSCFIKRGVPIDEAIWLEPNVLCKIEHVSWTKNYTLQEPTFVKLVDPEEEQEEMEKKERKKEKSKAARDAQKSK